MSDLQQLTNIATLSQSMINAAKKSAWEIVAEMQQQRKNLIAACFPLENPANDMNLIHEQLIKICKQDNALRALTKTQHEKYKSQLNMLIENKQASKTYLQIEAQYI